MVPHGTEHIRIVIADDQKRTRLGLKALLSTSLPMLEIWEASNGEEAVQLTEQTHPRLVVMDIRMPQVDGIAATRFIKSHWPGIKVLALSMYPDLEEEARAAGVDLFVGKGEPPERLLCALTSLL